MTVKLLTERHLTFLSLIVDCTGSSESIHVKMPHCWKSHVAAHIFFNHNAVFDDVNVYHKLVIGMTAHL